jgi:hypothetical protein
VGRNNLKDSDVEVSIILKFILKNRERKGGLDPTALRVKWWDVVKI